MPAFLIGGLIQGVVLALVAVTVVLTYQTTGVLNFALGALGMIAAFGWTSLLGVGPAWVGFVVVLVAGAAGGALLGLLTLPLRDSSPTVKAVASIGAVTALQAVAVLVWGTAARPVPALVDGTVVAVGGVVVTGQQVVTLAVAVAGAAGTVALFRSGLVGAGLRAVAADPTIARLVGLPVRTLWVVAWVIACFAAALAGMLIGARSGVTIAGLTFSVLTPLAAALVGRFRYPLTAAAAAVVLGTVDGLLSSQEALAGYRDLLPLAVVVAAMAAPAHRRTSWERV